MDDPFSLAGKKILVTGSSSGIGLATAQALSREGAEVFVTGRNHEKLEKAFASLEGEKKHHIIADLCNEEDVIRLVNVAPVLDGVFLNSGISPHLVPFQMENVQNIRHVFENNFFGPVNFLNLLLKKKKLANNASIVLNTGTASFVGPTATAAYSASKAALEILSRSAALDLARKHIRANCIAYGYVETELLENVITEEQRSLAPSGVPKAAEVVGSVLFLMSNASRWITRSSFVVDGGLSLKQARGF